MNVLHSTVSGTNMNYVHHQPVFSDTSLLHPGVTVCKEPPKRVLHLEKGRRNFLKDSSRRKKNYFPRTSLPPVSEEGISNVRSPLYAKLGPQKVIVKVKLVNPQVIQRGEEGKPSRFQSVEAAEALQHQTENAYDMTHRRIATPAIQHRTVVTPNSGLYQQYNTNCLTENENLRENMFTNNAPTPSARLQSLTTSSMTRNSYNPAKSNSNGVLTAIVRNSIVNDQRKSFQTNDRSALVSASQKSGNLYSKLTGNIDPKYKMTSNFKVGLSQNINTVDSSGQNQAYCNTLRMLQNGTRMQVEKVSNENNGTTSPTAPENQSKTLGFNQDSAPGSSNTPGNDLQDANRVKMGGSTTVSRPSEMDTRLAWNEIQKRKAKMREDFFKMPPEDHNTGMTTGRLRGRRSKSEPRLNALKSEVNKNQNILRENSKRDSAPMWNAAPRVSSPDLTNPSLVNAQNNNSNIQQADSKLFETSYSDKYNPKPTLYSKSKYVSVNNNNYFNRSIEEKENKNCQEQCNTNYTAKEISRSLEKETAVNVDPIVNNLRSLHESTHNPNVTRPTPIPRRSRSVAATRPHSLQDSNENLNKVGSVKNGSYTTRGHTADIRLNRDPNVAQQTVCLVTHVSQISPNVTVTRYRASIPYREKWEWIQKYGQNLLLSDHKYVSKDSQSVAEAGNHRRREPLRETSCPTSPVSASSVSSPDDSSCSVSSYTLSEKAIRSPTPSSGYNSCSNACSPSPIPSPDSCYTHPIMGETSTMHYTTKPHQNYRNNCSSPIPVREQYDSTPSTSHKILGDSFSSDYLPSSTLDTSDWSGMSCGRKPSDQDSSSSSSSSGCYSGASSPTPLAPPLVPHPTDHRVLPSAL